MSDGEEKNAVEGSLEYFPKSLLRLRVLKSGIVRGKGD
jgi:hypothetical protein